MSDVKCEKFIRSMSLHLDGRLGDTGERALREHLVSCKRCAERLAMLESAQSAARSSAAGEPRPGYWDDFSSRVMQRIDAGRESPAKSRWERLVAMFVPPRGRRLRVAAGLASIALAIAVGALYMEHQGERVIPPIARPPVDSHEGPAIAAKEEPSLPPAEQKFAESGAGKKPAPPAPSDKLAGAETKAGAMDKATSSPSAQDNGVDQEKTESPPGAQVLAQESAKRDQAEPTAGSPQGAGRKPETETAARDRKDRIEPSISKTYDLAGKSAVVRSPEGSYSIGGAVLQRISDEDSLVSDDGLRSIIAAWKTHMEENPGDSLNNEGYRQVAIAYGLLARRPGNEGTAEEGARVIQEYLDRAQDPLVKEFLAAKLVEIERFTQE